jgi:hypothetical protein
MSGSILEWWNPPPGRPDRRCDLRCDPRPLRAQSRGRGDLHVEHKRFPTSAFGHSQPREGARLRLIGRVDVGSGPEVLSSRPNPYRTCLKSKTSATESDLQSLSASIQYVTLRYSELYEFYDCLFPRHLMVAVRAQSFGNRSLYFLRRPMQRRV